MTKSDQHILDILRARSAWQRGTPHIGVNEVVELILRRYPEQPRPTPGDVIAAVQRLRARRLLRWTKMTGTRIHFIM
jgi:hypothetical protein